MLFFFIQVLAFFFKTLAGRIRYITKTRLYNFDPLKPHFYIVKLGFTGVYIIFLIFAQTIDCGYSLEPPRRGGVLTSTHNLLFGQEYEKYQRFLSENFHVLVVKFSVCICFRNERLHTHTHAALDSKCIELT